MAKIAGNPGNVAEFMLVASRKRRKAQIDLPLRCYRDFEQSRRELGLANTSERPRKTQGIGEEGPRAEDPHRDGYPRGDNTS